MRRTQAVASYGVYEAGGDGGRPAYSPALSIALCSELMYPCEV
jgi:hypothetical protein